MIKAVVLVDSSVRVKRLPASNVELVLLMFIMESWSCKKNQNSTVRYLVG